jgi:hypothetical protein
MKVLFIFAALVLTTMMLVGCSEELVAHNPLDPEGNCYIGAEAANQIYTAQKNLETVALSHGYQVFMNENFSPASVLGVEEITNAESSLKETAKKYGIILSVSYRKL